MTLYLQMDGVDDYASTTFTIPTDFIIETDFISSNLTGEHVIAAQYSSSTTGRFLFNTTGANLRVFLGGASPSNFLSNTVLQVGTRYKAKLIMQNKVASLYINDVLDKQFTFNSNIAQDTTMLLGRINGGASYFSGKLYSFKVSNLSSNTLLFYDMSTGTLQDQSGNGKHATLTGGTWLDDGAGGASGTDGSTAFDIRPSIYSDSFATSDTKQILYADSSFNSDIRNVLYQDATVQTDMKQAVYSDSASAYDTRIILYQDSATLFDTLQEFFSDGIVGSTPFDLRLILYADNLAVFDSRQAFFTDGVSFADLAQQFYQAGGLTADMKLVLYSDALSQFDAKQSLYSDTFVNADTAQRYYTEGTIDFDMLQAILDDWVQYRDVIPLVLNITRSQSVTLGFTQRMHSGLKL